MFMHLIKTSNRLTGKLVNPSVRFVHKGPEGAPPMRYISPAGHIARYLILVSCILSYPTYVLWNIDNFRPRPSNELSDEMQELMDQRKALRKEGKQPVLQNWPIIHKQEKSE